MRKPPKSHDIITDEELHHVAELQHALFVMEAKVHRQREELVSRVKRGAIVQSHRYEVDLAFGGVRSKRQVHNWQVVNGSKGNG